MIKPVVVSSGSTGELPADQELPSYQVLAALVVSLRGELARTQERTAELEDRLRATSRNSSGHRRATGWPSLRHGRGGCGRSPGAGRAASTAIRADAGAGKQARPEGAA